MLPSTAPSLDHQLSNMTNTQLARAARHTIEKRPDEVLSPYLQELLIRFEKHVNNYNL